MSVIKEVIGREILDSRGNPTVEAEVILASGARASAAVPSGASTGTFEALELRDKDSNRYQGQGVLKAVNNINTEIRKILIGREAEEQAELDKIMIDLDATENKSRLGANAILGVSLAICRAMSKEKNIPLYAYIREKGKFLKNKKTPVPMFNIINGGQHSDSGLSIQEYKIVPLGIKNFKEQLRAGSEIFHKLKSNLSQAGYSVAVGDEGGFAPKFESNKQALEAIVKAIEDAGYKLGQEVALGLDAAANSFFEEKEAQYILKPENFVLNRETLINLYREWIDKFQIISIEDGLQEEDWEGWRIMNEKVGGKIMLIGDDLIVTNVKRLKKAIDKKACNAVLIKVNQIGTLTETLDCIRLAKKNKMKVVVSHRSGETTDDFISDLAFGVGADFIKSGSLSRGERIVKYNRLLRIEEEINQK